MKLFIILLALSVKFIKCDRDQLLSNTIRPNTDEDTQQQAALNVIRRLIGEKADDVVIKINFKLSGNYFKVRNFVLPLNKLSPSISITRSEIHPRFACLVPENEQFSCASYRSVEWSFRLQRFPLLPETFLQRTSFMGWKSASIPR